jgi:hypothetical protein
METTYETKKRTLRESIDVTTCAGFGQWMRSAWHSLSNDPQLATIEHGKYPWIVANHTDKGAQCPYCEHWITR